MKKNIRISVSSFMIIGLLIFFALSCKDEFSTASTDYELRKAKTKERSIVYDIDGNIYHSVKIGTQVWMVENLKVTHYQNGDPIPNIPGNPEWTFVVPPSTVEVSVMRTTGAYCDYENDGDNSLTKGRLYNWYAVADSRKLAPKGWHIPSDAEWKILTDYLGGAEVAGGKLKETGTTHWESPNVGATNETGFTAFPAGCRFSNGEFSNYSAWWSSTEGSDDQSPLLFAWSRDMHYYDSSVGRKDYLKVEGYSVRCIKD